MAGFIPALAIGDRAAFANKRSARLQPRARQPGMHDLKRSHYENQAPPVIASRRRGNLCSGGVYPRLKRLQLDAKGVN